MLLLKRKIKATVRVKIVIGKENPKRRVKNYTEVFVYLKSQLLKVLFCIYTTTESTCIRM